MLISKKIKHKSFLKGMFILVSLVFLSSCASTELQAPPVCDNFGQNCEPKIPINQWTP